MSTLAELIAKRRADTSDKRTTKLNPGRNKVRILHSWRDNKEDAFWHDFAQHYIRGSDKVVKAVVNCLDKTFGQPCDVCDALNTGIASVTNDDTRKILEGGRSTGRVLVNALMLDSSAPDTPVVLELPNSVFNGVKGAGGIIGSMTEDYPELVSVDEGNDIAIEKTGSGLNTSYSVRILKSNTEPSKKALESLVNLDEFVQEDTASKMQRALANVGAVSGAVSGAALSYTGSSAPATFATGDDLDLSSLTSAETTIDEDLERDIDAAINAEASVVQQVAAEVANEVEAKQEKPANSEDEELANFLSSL